MTKNLLPDVSAYQTQPERGLLLGEHTSTRDITDYQRCHATKLSAEATVMRPNLHCAGATNSSPTLLCTDTAVGGKRKARTRNASDTAYHGIMLHQLVGRFHYRRRFYPPRTSCSLVSKYILLFLGTHVIRKSDGYSSSVITGSRDWAHTCTMCGCNEAMTCIVRSAWKCQSQ